MVVPTFNLREHDSYLLQRKARCNLKFQNLQFFCFVFIGLRDYLTNEAYGVSKHG